ncbi:hypothetical protein NN561_008026 [Cricetulus griseus]
MWRRSPGTCGHAPGGVRAVAGPLTVDTRARCPDWAGPAVFERSAGLRRRLGASYRRRSEIVAAALRAAPAFRPGSSRRRGEAATGVAVLLCSGSRYLGCGPRQPVGSARRGEHLFATPRKSRASPCAPSGRCPGEEPEVSGPARGAGPLEEEPGLPKASDYQL